MAFEIKKASRTSRRTRVALDGPSGSGKTYSLLRLGFALKAAGLCTKILVIDTENGSSELYAGESPDGAPWDFDVLTLTTFSPETYVQAMNHATRAGFDCLVIDSLSHEWMGREGALDMVDKKGGKFDAWAKVTPLHRQLIDAIVSSPAHVLASMRTKTDYVIEDAVNSTGRTVKTPRKLGMAPIQREGMEYEFDLYCSIDLDHQIRVTKSRCPGMQDATSVRPNPLFWQPLIDWLKGAAPVPPKPQSRILPRPAEDGMEPDQPINEEMQAYLRQELERRGKTVEAFLTYADKKHVSEVLFSQYADTLRLFDQPARPRQEAAK